MGGGRRFYKTAVEFLPRSAQSGNPRILSYPLLCFFEGGRRYFEVYKGDIF